MKKIILCEGDSWTSGDIINPKLDVTWVNHPTNDSYRLPKVWPHKLGELLNIEVLNTANAGCSNDSIVRRVVENTLKLLDKYKGEEIFVIVGWSSPEEKIFIMITMVKNIGKHFTHLLLQTHNNYHKNQKTNKSFTKRI